MSPTMTHGGAQQMTGGGAGQSDRTRAGNVNDRARTDARGDRAVIAGREDVGEQREVLDLRHRAIFVREFEQVEIGVGHHDVLRLAADPAAHIDIAVGRARTCRIDVQADAGLAFFAVAAAPAGDVERHGNQVADLDELDVAAGLDDLAGDLMAENQSVRRGRAAAHHVLVAAADIGSNDLQESRRDRICAIPVPVWESRWTEPRPFPVPCKLRHG